MKEYILELEKEFGLIMSEIIKKATKYGTDYDYIKNGVVLDFMSEKEYGQGKIFYEYMDLKNTYSSIINCSIYISSFPFSGKVSKVDYLKFIYSGYLNEIYILQSRITRLTKTITRCLKKCKSDNNFIENCKQLELSTQTASKFFKSLVDVRGEHVHKKRYDTLEMNKVAGYEFVFNVDLKLKSDENMKKIVNLSTKILRKEYVEILENNQENISEIINNYSKSVKQFLFDNNYIDKVENYKDKR